MTTTIKAMFIGVEILSRGGETNGANVIWTYRGYINLLGPHKRVSEWILSALQPLMFLTYLITYVHVLLQMEATILSKRTRQLVG